MDRSFHIVMPKVKMGGYSVANLALEGCYSQGETIEEALNIKEATLLYLEDEDLNNIEKEVSLYLVTV